MNINVAGPAASGVEVERYGHHGQARHDDPHSRADEAVPFADSEELLRYSDLPPEALVVVGFEHRLADDESLAAMLEVVEGRFNTLHSTAIYNRWNAYRMQIEVAVQVNISNLTVRLRRLGLIYLRDGDKTTYRNKDEWNEQKTCL